MILSNIIVQTDVSSCNVLLDTENTHMNLEGNNLPIKEETTEKETCLEHYTKLEHLVPKQITSPDRSNGEFLEGSRASGK